MRTGRKPKSVEEIDDCVIHQLLGLYDIDSNGCWIWLGAYYESGYGRLSRVYRSTFHERAHIASYQFHKGCVPEGVLFAIAVMLEDALILNTYSLVQIKIINLIMLRKVFIGDTGLKNEELK
jgi:hypothetical protein